VPCRRFYKVGNFTFDPNNTKCRREHIENFPVEFRDGIDVFVIRIFHSRG
jgi:hypothetical protein